MFLVAAVIFTVLMYIVFAFGFPIRDDTANGKLVTLYQTIMIFSLISAILVVCQILSGARRIEGIHAEYGRFLKMQGMIFCISNCVTSITYYFLMQQQIYFRTFSFFTGTIFQLAFFTATELLPLMGFVKVANKFV